MLYRYYFKRACNEFELGFVYEEINDDSTVLPLLDGKISAKISRLLWWTDVMWSLTLSFCRFRAVNNDDAAWFVRDIKLFRSVVYFLSLSVLLYLFILTDTWALTIMHALGMFTLLCE